MQLRIRQMGPKDIHKCVALVAVHPEERRRYGPLLELLPSAWLKLLRTESLKSTLVEDTDSRTPELVALGVSVFITDVFLTELKTHPRPWMGPTLTERLQSILTARQIREANSKSGLNLAVWSGVVSESRMDQMIHVELWRGFYDTHVGYRIKELVCQPLDLQQINASFQTGLLWLSHEGQYVDGRSRPFIDFAESPFILGADRDAVNQAFGSWLFSLFSCNPPRMYFRPSEQRLLLAALRGLTDGELADELGISLSAVKKNWRMIYERTGRIWDETESRTADGEGDGKRGKERKQHVLTYVRAHMEELRPVLPPVPYVRSAKTERDEKMQSYI
jgi:hypothetical protein